MSEDKPGEVFGKSSSNSSEIEGTAAKAVGGPDTDLLKSIDATLEDILTSVNGMSQSAARSSMPGSRRDANKWKPNRGSNKTRFGNKSLGDFSSVIDKFSDGLEESLMDSILGADFKSKMESSMSSLASELGAEVSDIPELLGKELGNQLVNSKLGQSITGKLKGFIDKAMSSMSDAFKSGQSATSYKDAISKGFKSGTSNMFTSQDADSSASAPKAQDMQDTVNQAMDIADTVQDIKGKGSKVIDFPGTASKGAGLVDDAASMATKAAPAAEAAAPAVETVTAGATAAEAGTTAAATAGTATAAAGTATATALTGVASAAAAACPYILAAVAALIIIDAAFDTLAPAIEGAKAAFQAMSKAANRYQESRKKNLELSQKRLEADARSMIEAPFTILQQAAQNLYDAWDSQIQTITATQGYNKEDVQSLMSSYAQRLRDEGLTNVVSGSDIVQNLSNVLNSGLSGQVAEEFAYLATKLNAAVPTQDFFSYASTYASIAANAIKDGKSQSEAIAYANAEMETFASNVLYASRQLSGGFSSGLKDAQQLFDYSVQIANASKTGDASTISSVLTSVSAIAGAVAPDLAGGIVEAVVKAATGGNSSEIVALRSLAGINASNTEFLKALAQDPQGVFSALFSNLAKMQNMSNDNFMEVAEGLSSVFGISMDAFARVDFNYLADAISQMNVNNASLDENMDLLISGQTTTTAEQLRMAQINQYMLEEGLAYVLDNEVARQIQQHMWDEQLAREMMEASYAVELQGSALQFLEGIMETIDNIRNFLNPFSFTKKIANLVATKDEVAAINADKLQLLELGKVGKGDLKSLYNLITTNKDLQLVEEITTLMGGNSLYGASKSMLSKFNDISNFSGLFNANLGNSAGAFSPSSGASQRSSKYAWANVSKSVASALLSAPAGTGLLASTSNENSSLSNAVKNKSNANFEKFLDTMEAAVGEDKSYEEWVATASKYGIKDFESALDTFGRTEAELRGVFGDYEAKKASQYAHNRETAEDVFWKEATLFATNDQPGWTQWETLITDNQTSMIAQLVDVNTKLENIHTKEKEFLDAWTSYYVDHTAYSENTMSAYKAADIIKAEKKENGDAVLALANALTDNTIGITQGFKDPVVQTNVLLAKILIVAEAIMQQNNKTGGLSLPDSLAALGLGMTSETS